MSSIGKVVLCSFPRFLRLRSFCEKVTVNQPRVAIVGSGPAGFYTAHQLIKVSLTTNHDSAYIYVSLFS